MLKKPTLIQMVGKNEQENLKLVGNIIHKNKLSNEAKNYDLTVCQLKLSPIVGGVNADYWDNVTCKKCLKKKPKSAE